MIGIELFYAIGSLWKYMAVKHFKKLSALVHIVGQSTLMVVFLSLVFGMTFKGYKYGNASTSNELDLNKWGYGENICLLVVSIALLIELCLFFTSIIMLVKNLFFTVIGMFIDVSADDKLKNKFLKEQVKLLKKDQKGIVTQRMKDGVFYKLVEPK